MSAVPFKNLTCPLDRKPLYAQGMTWRCEDGHSFDIAREGYTYLLPVQNKRSLDPGDSKAMVAARQRFLNAGHYHRIAEAVNQMVLADLPVKAGFSCLDAGCGEGYYVRQLMAAAGERPLSILGLDISKWAIQAAAKQDKAATCGWVVASNANIPAPEASMDRLLCLFGFPVYSEFARVLKVGGRLIQLDAGPSHLRELREIIYPVLKPERTDELPVPPGFRLLTQGGLSDSLFLQGSEVIADLLVMTPHLYRASAEGKARAADLSCLQLSLEVRWRCFERILEEDLL